MVEKLPKILGSQATQYFVAICACIAELGYGAYQVWPSPSIPFLTSEKSQISISEEQSSWIVSIFLIGDLCGGLINPFIMNQIGRKYTILVSVILGLIGWITITLADSYIYLCIARLIGGIGQGIILCTLVIYLAEISEKNVRGIFINFMKISENAGIFIFILTSVNVSYYILNWTCMIAPILFIVLSFFLPESPYYYFMQKKEAKAIKCLKMLRGNASLETLEIDILKIKLTIIEDKKNSKTAFQDLIKKNYNRRGLAILVFVKLGQQLTGINTVWGYAEQIFIDCNSPIDPKYSVLVLTAFQLLTCCFSSCAIDRVSRKILFLVTGCLQALSLGAMGMFFLLRSYLKVDVSSFTWVPLVALILYEIVYSIGVGPVTYVLQGELFPMSVKGAASACGNTIGAFFAFLGTIAYPMMKNSFGEHAPFWFYAANALISSLMTFWITPETMGKTLEEIQAMDNLDLNNKLEAISETKKREESIF